MGKVVERKKKKGRPSLLDLQKRSLKEQQQQQFLLHQNRLQQNDPNSSIFNHKSGPSTPLRRSALCNSPLRDGGDDNSLRRLFEENAKQLHGKGEDDDDEEAESDRREKKFKSVLKLPEIEKPDQYLRVDDSELNGDLHHDTSNRRKRKVNKVDAVVDGSMFKEEYATSVSKDGEEQGLLTPLPDQKLLLFILDRLQKKDTYGVFSEPVDPEELPDYHEVIEHPMDFGTIRRRLTAGFYANLEQFERDVFLICSNAMHYNAPDTIYFRQARSIQELARKDFENVRQESDEDEPEHKVVKRGRPPTKNLKRAMQRLYMERPRSEFSPEAENPAISNNSDPRRLSISERLEPLGKHSVSRSDSIWFNESRIDDAAVQSSRSGCKQKRQMILDENRRNTYRQYLTLSVAREASALTTFDAERKQLMAVGLMSEYGYARSLARFAANIGCVAWKMASKRIERALPEGVGFGAGWVGENDVSESRPLFPFSPSSSEAGMWPRGVVGKKETAQTASGEVTAPGIGKRKVESESKQRLEGERCAPDLALQLGPNRH